MKTRDAISRSDRVLVAAMAIIIATASAAIGASMTYHPSTEKVVAAPVVTEAPAAPVADAVLTGLLAEHRCLSEVMYYEARGEGASGQKAIAEVVFHRMNTGNFGHSICAVVYEGAGQTFCQFTFVCDGSLDKPREPEAWRQAQVLAARMLSGEVSSDAETGDATYYHTVDVHPTWAPHMARVAQIGRHIFYRAAQKPVLVSAAFRGSLQ